MSKYFLADKKKKRILNPAKPDKKEKPASQAKFEFEEEFWEDCKSKEAANKTSSSQNQELSDQRSKRR